MIRFASFLHLTYPIKGLLSGLLGKVQHGGVTFLTVKSFRSHPRGEFRIRFNLEIRRWESLELEDEPGNGDNGIVFIFSGGSGHLKRMIYLHLRRMKKLVNFLIISITPLRSGFQKHTKRIL